MATVLLVLVVVLVVAGLVFGVVSLLSGDDPGISAAEADGRARPLPNNRSLSEFDLKDVRFDTGFRGYRMSQVDRALRRTAYDLGYKDEMIAVLEAEVSALREGRKEDAELLRKAREAAASPVAEEVTVAEEVEPVADADPDGPVEDFSGTRRISTGTAETAEVDVAPDRAEGGRHAAAADESDESLPREGSLRRRPDPPEASAEPTVDGDTADDPAETAVNDDSSSHPVDRPAPRG
jgi:DivIVA domain-containing protein